jgi:lysozyme
MKTKEHILLVQAALGIPEKLRYPNVGPLTKKEFNRLAATPINEEFLRREEEPEPEEERRNISARGLDLVKHFEGLYLNAYKDQAGVWTIGYGHTGMTHKDGTVYKGRTITESKASQLLDYDMNQSEEAVTALAKVPTNDDQFSALVSWHFNTGGPANATLWVKLNAGDYQGAADQLLRWNKVNGRAVRGLTRRRQSERNLFLGKEDYLVEY